MLYRDYIEIVFPSLLRTCKSFSGVWREVLLYREAEVPASSNCWTLPVEVPSDARRGAANCHMGPLI